MKDYQIKKLKEFREIEVFSLFFISFAGITNKFFGRKKLKQQRIKTRYTYLNEFDYQIYWTKWKKSWKIIK